MTHVDDLHEVNDRQPGEPEPEPTYTLDQIEAALAAALRGRDPHAVLDPAEKSDADQAESFLLDTAVPQLLAELRAARRRIAEFEALPGRAEFATTDQATGREVPPHPHHPYRVTAGEALKAHEKGRQAWVRRLTVHPWEPISPEAPF